MHARNHDRSVVADFWALLKVPSSGSGTWGVNVWFVTQQRKKHSEPETGTLINPSPVGERKPCFTDGHWILEPNGHCRST